MWRFLLLLGFFGSAQAADEKPDPALQKSEAPKPQLVKPAQVWDQSSGAFVALSEAVKRARGRLVLDQVFSPRDRALQADGIKVIEARDQYLLDKRLLEIRNAEDALVARYRGL